LGLKHLYDNWFEYYGAITNHGVNIVSWLWKASHVGWCSHNQVFYCAIIKDLRYHCEKIGNNAKNLHLCELYSSGIIQLNEYINLILWL
jgi:hypothetical protein